ncbi:hypothetical protein [Defluviimonas sp. WL0002]|uniref:hypothetical protein n=1 Tax=Albidovulum marisflavi TaxID=2984159 RepID=UPI0021E82187|nr:hypothetical protein [Defluviimonas sp. WL0002]
MQDSPAAWSAAETWKKTHGSKIVSIDFAPSASPCSTTIAVLFRNPYVTCSKDDRAIGTTIARFDEIVGRVEDGDCRIKARPAKRCENCDMRAYCDTKNWHFRKNE